MADALLDAFIETDVLRWLESQTAPIEDAPKPLSGVPMFFLTRDYERELNEALDADEITRAKHILHDLKDRFDEAPDGTAEKNQIKSILISLYEQFRMRLERDDEQDRADVEISRLMRSWGIQPIEGVQDAADVAVVTAPTPVRPHKETQRRDDASVAPVAPVVAEAAPVVAPAIDPRARRLQNARVARARDLLDAVDHDLTVGDVRAAATGYRATRREVLGIDGGVPDDVARRLLTTFERVRDALHTASSTRRHLHIAPPPVMPVVSTPVVAPASVAVPMPLPEAPSSAPQPVLAPTPDVPAPSDASRAVPPTPVPPMAPVLPSSPIAPAALPPLPYAATPSTADIASFDQAIISMLETRKHELDAAVERHDMMLAMRIYDGMRTAALHLRDADRQSDVARKLRLLHELLARLRHSTHDDRGLSGRVP